MWLTTGPAGWRECVLREAFQAALPGTPVTWVRRTRRQRNVPWEGSAQGSGPQPPRGWLLLFPLANAGSPVDPGTLAKEELEGVPQGSEAGSGSRRLSS